MTIADMHVYFRQYAQQMGMQNVRAITPEQIDILLNTAISDKVNAIIQDSITKTNDQQNVNHTQIGGLNVLERLLFTEPGNQLRNHTILNNNVIYTYNYIRNNKPIDFLYISFRLHYTDNLQANIKLVDDGTKIYDNDYINKATLLHPIGYKQNGDLTINCGNKKIFEKYISSYDIKIDSTYIKFPDKVKYSTDASQCVDCNLSQFVHVDIVKDAVNLYLNSIRSGRQNVQQNPYYNPTQQNVVGNS